jgi:hypothetical protein
MIRGFEHLVLTTDAIVKAVELWAFIRQSGVPTAWADALDADAILPRGECLVRWVRFGVPLHPLGVLHALRVLYLPGWLPPGLCGFFPVPSHSSALRISRSCTWLANVEDSSLLGLVP